MLQHVPRKLDARALRAAIDTHRSRADTESLILCTSVTVSTLHLDDQPAVPRMHARTPCWCSPRDCSKLFAASHIACNDHTHELSRLRRARACAVRLTRFAPPKVILWPCLEQLILRVHVLQLSTAP